MENKRDLSTEEWKAEKKKKKAQMAAMQAQPYDVKIRRAEKRALEFIGEQYGWGRVLDYIGVGWEDVWLPEPEQIELELD